MHKLFEPLPKASSLEEVLDLLIKFPALSTILTADHILEAIAKTHLKSGDLQPNFTYLQKTLARIEKEIIKNRIKDDLAIKKATLAIFISFLPDAIQKFPLFFNDLLGTAEAKNFMRKNKIYFVFRGSITSTCLAFSYLLEENGKLNLKQYKFAQNNLYLIAEYLTEKRKVLGEEVWEKLNLLSYSEQIGLVSGLLTYLGKDIDTKNVYLQQRETIQILTKKVEEEAPTYPNRQL